MKRKKFKILAAMAVFSLIIPDAALPVNAEDIPYSDIPYSDIQPPADTPSDETPGTTDEARYCDQHGHQQLVNIYALDATEWTEGRDEGLYCDYCHRWVGKVPDSLPKQEAKVNYWQIKAKSSQKGQLQVNWPDLGHGCTYLVQCSRGIKTAKVQDLRDGYGTYLFSGTTYKYTGKPIRPKVLVAPYFVLPKKYISGQFIRKDGYSVSYRNNVKPGIGEVIVKGKAPYFKSEIHSRFRILDHTPSPLEDMIYSTTYGEWVSNELKSKLLLWSSKRLYSREELLNAESSIINTLDPADRRNMGGPAFFSDIKALLDEDRDNRNKMKDYLRLMKDRTSSKAIKKDAKKEYQDIKEHRLLTKKQIRRLKTASKHRKTVESNLDLLTKTMLDSTSQYINNGKDGEGKKSEHVETNNLYWEKGQIKNVNGNSATFTGLKSGKKYRVRITVIYNGKKEGTTSIGYRKIK